LKIYLNCLESTKLILHSKLPYNVCAPFIPTPTPLASLWVGSDSANCP